MAKKEVSKNLIQEQSSIEYFKSLVESAIENQHLEIEEIEEFYIVNLLTEHVRSENVYVNLGNATHEEPLASILSRAVQAEYDGERVRLFKKLGDFTLFISGFFAASLSRKLIDVDYYRIIGESAYSNLSYVMKKKNQGEMFYTLFKNLAERFESHVDIIAEVSDKSFVHSDKGVLRLYERWVKTGAQKDADLLQKEGIIPVSQESSYLQ